jgi:ribosome-binding factor A
MDPHRTLRLAEALREELAELIAYEMSDPRVGEVTVSEVITSPDKRHAQVRIGLVGGGDPKEALLALEHARGFLRLQLSERLETFRIPELHFEADVSATLGPRMETLLKRMRKGRPKEGSQGVKEPGSLGAETASRPDADPAAQPSRDRKGADYGPAALPDSPTPRLPDSLFKK